MLSGRFKFSIFLFIPQVLFIILFGIFVDYDTEAGGIPFNKTESNEFQELYPMFQDVHVMIFIGFGFLMTFLKRYSFGSVGFNLLLSAFVIQWVIIIRGLLDLHGIVDGKIDLNLSSLLNADFCCGSILISFGAVLGVLSPVQLVAMAFFEVVFYAVNELILIEFLQISDIGGSLVIHAFGAYFGIAVSAMHWRKELKDNPKEGSNYHSDLFAMIGTLFLWLFWPSFNGAPAAGTMAGQRAVINTVYSLSAAGVSAFAISSIVDKSGKLSMVHIQNATLAGGVAIGSVANLKIGLFSALIIGSSAGVLSVIGYDYITPILQRALKLHDTCGVHNLHGMPGLLSAIAAVIVARYTTQGTYTAEEIEGIYPGLAAEGPPYNYNHQAQMQAAAFATTLGVSIAGGIITGIILRIPFLTRVTTNNLFDDKPYWLLPDDVHSSEETNGTADIPLDEKKRKESLDVKITDNIEEANSQTDKVVET